MWLVISFNFTITVSLLLSYCYVGFSGNFFVFVNVICTVLEQIILLSSTNCQDTYNVCIKLYGVSVQVSLK